MNRAAWDVKLLTGLIDVGQLLEAGHDLRNRLANAASVLHGMPIEQTVLCATGSPVLLRLTQRHFGDRSDDLNFTLGSNVPRRTAVGKPHVVEHRFLCSRLRLFI